MMKGLPGVSVILLSLSLSSGKTPRLYAQENSPRGLDRDRWGDLVLGQPDFTEIAMNETTGDRVWDPGGVLVDESFEPPRLWVWDTNGRVLGVELSTPVSEAVRYRAKVVIGQKSADRSTCNGDSSFQNGFPSPSAATLCAQNVRQLSISEAPSTSNMALDSEGRLYVPDPWNNRVLVYDDPWNDPVADRVWGQDGFDKGIQLAHFGCNRGVNDRPSATSLCFQTDIRDGSGFEGGVPGVFVDAADNLWVADPMNHRVLRYPRAADGYPAAAADLVLGQYNFESRDTSSCWEGLKTDGSSGPYDPFLLCRPAAVVVDEQERVYVADAGRVEAGWEGRFFGRIVTYQRGSRGWEVVAIGDGKGTWTRENPDFRLIDPRTGGLRHPTGLSFDPDGHLWVTDTGNHQLVLLNRSTGAVLNVLGRSKPTWEYDPTGHPACGADPGGRYRDEMVLPWEDGSSFIGINLCDPKGNAGSLPNRDVLAAAQACFQDLFLFPVSRYAMDSRPECRDFDPAYSWYDPDCRPYAGARIFNRTQGCQRNQVAARSLGFGSHRIGYARNSRQLLVDDNGSIKIWNEPHSLETHWAEPGSVWAHHPLRQVSGSFVEWRQPYSSPSVDDSGAEDILWLVVRDRGVEKLVAYLLPLTGEPEPLVELASPLPVAGGGSLSWRTLTSIAGRSTLTAEGFLWAADVMNHRVFRIRNPRFGPSVDFVLGQPALGETSCNQGSGPAAHTLCNPGTVALDYYGNLFVGDHFLENWGNGRLLEWDARHFAVGVPQVQMGLPANRVYFTEGDFHRGGVFCGQLNGAGVCAPMGFGFDENGYLFVGLNPYASSENFYPRVWFDPLGDWREPPDAAISDYHSMAMSFDADDRGNVYIHDHNRARILRYDQPWAFQGRAAYGQECPEAEAGDLWIQNPSTQPVSVRLVWTFQDKGTGEWATESTSAILDPGETFHERRTEANLDLVDTTISSEEAPYRSILVTSESRCVTDNQPPIVSAGPDQVVTLPSPAVLNGSAEDDGLPVPPGALSLRWSLVSGPGTIEWTDGSSATTTASFSTNGVYVLRLTAEDGAFSVSDDVMVSVELGSDCQETVPSHEWQASYWSFGGGVPEEPVDTNPLAIPGGWGPLHLKENASARYGQADRLGIDFDASGGGPNRCGLGSDRFVTMFRRTVDFQNGLYNFVAGGDDGIKLWVHDGEWKALSECASWELRRYQEKSCTYAFSGAGPREVLVAYFENGGSARVKLDWEPIAGCEETVPARQWQAEFWTYGLAGSPPEPSDTDPLSVPSGWGSRKLVQNATTRYGQRNGIDISFDALGGGPLRCGVGNERFITRFRRTVYFNRGTYYFTAGSDDGIKVWVNDGGWKNLAACEHWGVRGFSEKTCRYTFRRSGWRNILVTYFEDGGAARVKLKWRR